MFGQPLYCTAITNTKRIVMRASSLSLSQTLLLLTQAHSIIYRLGSNSRNPTGVCHFCLFESNGDVYYLVFSRILCMNTKRQRYYTTVAWSVRIYY